MTTYSLCKSGATQNQQFTWHTLSLSQCDAHDAVASTSNLFGVSLVICRTMRSTSSVNLCYSSISFPVTPTVGNLYGTALFAAKRDMRVSIHGALSTRNSIQGNTCHSLLHLTSELNPATDVQKQHTRYEFQSPTIHPTLAHT